jgi:hypothetical protein
MKSLIYFYEVKKGDKDNSEERIGIIPFIYEEAKKYYQNANYWREQEAKKIMNQKPNKEVVVAFEKPKEKELELFDLNSLEEGDD